MSGEYAHRTERVRCWHCQAVTKVPARPFDAELWLKKAIACSECGQWMRVQWNNDQLQSRAMTKAELLKIPDIMWSVQQDKQRLFEHGGLRAKRGATMRISKRPDYYKR